MEKYNKNGLNFRVSNNMHQDIIDISKKLDCTKTSLMREAVEEFLPILQKEKNTKKYTQEKPITINFKASKDLRKGMFEMAEKFNCNMTVLIQAALEIKIKKLKK